MNGFGWACVGALVTVAGMALALAYVVRALDKQPELALGALAGLIRMFCATSGYKSFLIVRGKEPLVVAFEDVARAIEKGDLLTHVPVQLEPSTLSEPPSPDGCDGRA